MRTGRILALLAAGVVVLAMSACDGGTADQSGEPPEDVRIVSQPGSYTALKTIEELRPDAVLVVTPVEELEEFWPDLQPQQWVWSRWHARVDRVLVGDLKVGQVIVVAVPGGHVAADKSLSIQTGVLTGRLKPGSGDKTTLAVWEGQPRFEVGRVELVFLKASTAMGVAVPFLIPIEGRFVVGPAGTLASTLTSETPVTREIAQLGVDGLEQRLKTRRP